MSEKAAGHFNLCGLPELREDANQTSGLGHQRNDQEGSK
jgi:hypothetical protein